MFNFLSKSLFPYIRPYKGRITVVILLSFAIAGIGALQVSLVKPIFDRGLSPDSTNEEILILAGKLLGLGLIHFPCRFFHFYWIRSIVEQATCRVREDLFSKIQLLPLGTFSRNKQGQMISRVMNDSQVFSHGFQAMIDLVREPLKAIAYLGMAFWADWQLTLVIFLIAPFLVAIFSVSGKKVRRNQSHVQQQHGELTHSIAEGIGALKLTKAFNLRDFVVDRFRRAQNAFLNAQMKTIFVEEIAHPLVEVVGAAAFSAVIIFAHHRIQIGATTVGEFISFVAALALFMDPIRKFSQANVKIGQARAAGDRVMSLLQEMQEPDDGIVSAKGLERGIEIKNLSFDYGEGPVLKGCDFTIKKGEKVALVGLSGSGKSTLINLLLGLYPVSQGEILIDDTPISQIKLKELRDLFGLVSQDIFLFNDTIKANLCLGESFSDTEIDNALRVAYAAEFIEKLPQGLETIIGDRGTRLSGGQQQRLTIARAFLHRSDVLLFDEATSALDNESEKVVQKALEQIGHEKTVIAVAHRLSSVQEYDRIYVLKEGLVIEYGTHAQLMGKNGEYAKLYALSQKLS